MLKLKPVLTVEQRVLPCVRGSLAYVEAETCLDCRSNGARVSLAYVEAETYFEL